MSRRVPRRTVSAIVIAAALTIAGLASTTAADASTPSPWDAIAQCESGGDWSIDTGNGYYGGLQFSAATWRAHGGTGSAATASRAEQIRIGERVVATQGWEAWAGCAARLGLRGRSIPSAAGERKTPRAATEQPLDLSVQTVVSTQRRYRPGGAVTSKKIAACTARTLEVRYIGTGSMAGARYADLEFINTGPHRCRLAGASRTVLPAPAPHDAQVGVIAAAASTPVHKDKAASKRPHLVLSAHGGRAHSRIVIRSTVDRGKHCRPVGATMVRGGSDSVDAALHGLRLQTCAQGKYKVLSLGHPRSNRSSTHR